MECSKPFNRTSKFIQAHFYKKERQLRVHDCCHCLRGVYEVYDGKGEKTVKSVLLEKIEFFLNQRLFWGDLTRKISSQMVQGSFQNNSNTSWES